MSTIHHKKKVRFAQKHETYEIDPRETEHRTTQHRTTHPQPRNKDPVDDDEVKGHPSIEIKSQLDQDPTRKTITNDGKRITRFGKNYWKLIETLFGKNSVVMKDEIRIYEALHKTNHNRENTS